MPDCPVWRNRPGTSPEDVQQGFAKLATSKQFSIFAKDFFGRFTNKCLDYFLSKAMAHHVGEPLLDEYDLLIYSKNGHRPGLLEHLCEAFPRHVVLHYGQYRREQLFEAARRSRACAYLADDDHGPLALQEILLAGCPTVGVRTGASFVRHGATGYVVERLPPGRECVANDDDEASLRLYLDAIHRAESLDRQVVRSNAAANFATSSIVSGLIAALDEKRTLVPRPS